MTDDAAPGGTVPDPRRAPDDRPPAPAVPLARRADPSRPGGSAVATIAPPWLRAPAPVSTGRPADDRPGRGLAAVVALAARDGRSLGRRRTLRAAADPPPDGAALPRPPRAVPAGSGGDVDAAGTRGSAAPPVVLRPAVQRARPRIEPEPSILGLSRMTRGRVGSRIFTLFFVLVYALITVQLVVTLLRG